VLVLDGGLATELEKAGFDLDHPLWSARVLESSPSAIARVHRSYLEAGADCITTASYQATLVGFERPADPGVLDPRANRFKRRRVDAESLGDRLLHQQVEDFARRVPD